MSITLAKIAVAASLTLGALAFGMGGAFALPTIGNGITVAAGATNNVEQVYWHRWHRWHRWH